MNIPEWAIWTFVVAANIVAIAIVVVKQEKERKHNQALIKGDSND